MHLISRISSYQYYVPRGQLQTIIEVPNNNQIDRSEFSQIDGIHLLNNCKIHHSDLSLKIKSSIDSCKQYNFVLVKLVSVFKKHNEPYNLGYKSANQRVLDISRISGFRVCEPTITTSFRESDEADQTMRTLLQISGGGELGKSSSPGARARNDACNAVKSKPVGGVFAEAWIQNPSKRLRPAAANRLAQQLQSGQADGRTGLFGRFSVKSTPDPFNPGCAGGPRSITVLSSQDNPSSSVEQNTSSSSMETMSRRLSPEYEEYQQKFNSPPVSKRFDTTQYDQQRFQQLAKDPNAKKEVFHKKTVDEARTAIHAETEGLVDNAQRMEKPICKSVDLDFKVDGPAPYTHMDAKHPVGSEILAKQNSPDTLQKRAEDTGKSIVKQKDRFCGLEQGPESSENFLHIVDLAYVPSHEKEIVKEYLIKGAGSSEGIRFLNDK